MKIVINAVSAKMGGAVTYLTNVLRRLPPPESGDEFVVFLPPETARKQGKLPANIHVVPTTIGHAKWWKRLWWDQITLRRNLKRLHADVLFSSANFGMIRCPVRQILLVRIQLYFSRTYIYTILPLHSLRSRTAFRLRRWLCCQSVRWADVVMTPTQAMLDDLRQFVRMGSQKAVVNHYGVELPQKLRNRDPKPQISHPPDVVRLLYVSLYAEHKNLNTLLKAMPILNGDSGLCFVLVTPVNPNWAEAGRSATRKRDLELSSRPEIVKNVNFIEPLDPQRTQDLYEKADIFVFPALTESFGHPMAEAMAHGLPIVAADTPVNREMCSDAAVYFSPLDPEHLARAVHRVAVDAALRRRLADEGRRRVRERFRWDEHVRRILEIARPVARAAKCCGE